MTTKLSRNPYEIKEIVNRTDSCINGHPIEFFKELSEDIGTLYFITYPQEYDNRLQDIPANNKNISYSRLYLLQNLSRTNNILGVDAVWFDKQNKEVLNNSLNQLNKIKKEFNTEIIDNNITTEYVNQHNKEMKIFISEEPYYKVGKVSPIERHIETLVRTNDAYYSL